MKKSAAKRKTPASKTKKKRSNPLDRLLSDADVDLIRRLLLDAESIEKRSAEDMVGEFLTADPTDIDDMPDPEAMSELSEELDRLRIDANGGDAEARETLKRARDMIDKAARQDDIHPGILMILGRLFAGSHVDIGDAARASMGRMVGAGLFHEPGDEAYHKLVRPLLNDLSGDDFSLHEEIRGLFAIFPSDFTARLVEALAADSADRARRSAVGFLLDVDDSTALAAIRGLAASAARGGLDDVARRRIDLIRGWLPSARRQRLDEALPLASGPPARAVAQIVKTSASACDGSGAASLIATVKRGARFDVVALMTKSSGIADAIVLEGLPKAEAAEVEIGARGAMPSAKTPHETWLQLVRLALGRNLATGTPPPFEFVRAMETIGVETLAPDLSTPAETLDSLLADVVDRDDAAAVRTAHESVIDCNAVDKWFEAGEAVENVLRPTGAVEEGAQALLEIYLPGRRAFWASQCALTALALREASPPEP